MRRWFQWLNVYKGFLITGVLSLAIIAVYIYGEHSLRHEAQQEATGPLLFVSLAWQEQAISEVRDIVDHWNMLHPEQPVELRQGTWGSIHDYLITGFETGDLPDVFHYESAVIVDFALRGYLADLKPYISDTMQEDILDVFWDSVTRSDGSVVGIPFIAESFIILYNRDLLAAAGVQPPTSEKPWSWSDLMAAARTLTRDTDGDGDIDQWGAGMGLRRSANFIMNHSIAFGGSYFYEDSLGQIETRVGAAEQALLNNVMTMLYEDRSMNPASVGKSSSEMIPGFLAGNTAMLVGIGAWARQQVIENAAPDFNWGVMPPVQALTQDMGLNTQTLSIPRRCTRKAQAMAFIEFMLQTDHMTRLSASDWMMPTRRSSLADERFQGVDDGWQAVIRSAQYLSTGPWVGLPGYIEWKSRVANPVFQELFSNRMTVGEAAERIERESNAVLARYQVRGLKW